MNIFGERRKRLEVLERAGDKLLCHALIKTKLLVKDREFVLAQRWRLEEEVGYILLRSIPLESVPNEPKHVRANMLHSSIVVSPTGESSCKVQYYCQVHMGGSIPNIALNAIQLRMAENLRGALEELQEAFN